MKYQEFSAEIESIVEEAIANAKEYGSDASENIWETIDGHQWVIYYSYAWDLVNFARGYGDILRSGEDEAESMGIVPDKDGIDTYMTRLAFCIMYAACGAELSEREEAADDEEEEEATA